MTDVIAQLPQYNFNFNELKCDVLRIIEKYNLPQIGLTHSDRNLSDIEKIKDCTGSIFDYESKKFRFKETDFTEFNKEFLNTSLYELYKSVSNVGRFRIMTMYGPSCYTIHRDLSMRYHYVIETHPDCLFLFPENGKQIHIPCDQRLYLLDTRLRHTFVNGSKNRRIHLVLDDLESLNKKE